ncbi:2101_t:CDS:1, partial [Paraglomus occultum]
GVVHSLPASRRTGKYVPLELPDVDNNNQMCMVDPFGQWKMTLHVLGRNTIAFKNQKDSNWYNRT